MKNIKTYQQFNSVNEEEGWKEKLLAASLAATSLTPAEIKAKETDKSAQEISYQETEKELDDKTIDWPWKPKTKTLRKKVTSEKEAEKLEDKGWSLDSMQADTLWTEVTKQKPDTVVTIDEIKFDDNQYFASGRYVLNQDMKDSIDNMISDIVESGGIISGVQIESSTDKQGLSKRLQDELQGLGYEPNNSGLAQIRSDQVRNYLVDFGIKDSLITSNQKVEAGSGTIDASARYVILKIAYLDKTVLTTPEITDRVPEVKEVYYLSKEVIIKKSPKKKKQRVKRHRTKIKKCRGRLKCYEF